MVGGMKEYTESSRVLFSQMTTSLSNMYCGGLLTEAKACPRRTTAQRGAEGAASMGTEGAATSASDGGGAAAERVLRKRRPELDGRRRPCSMVEVPSREGKGEAAGLGRETGSGRPARLLRGSLPTASGSARTPSRRGAADGSSARPAQTRGRRRPLDLDQL
nr:uncharacterized protein LOC127305615 [Lolium perenne]